MNIYVLNFLSIYITSDMITFIDYKKLFPFLLASDTNTAPNNPQPTTK